MDCFGCCVEAKQRGNDMKYFNIYRPVAGSTRMRKNANFLSGQCWTQNGDWYYRHGTGAGVRFDGGVKGHDRCGPWPSQAEASAACMIAEQRLCSEARIACAERRADERVAQARAEGKANIDLALAMEVLAEYRGPRGEHYEIKFVAVARETA